MALSADDRLDILQLIARYNHAIDFGQCDEWADTFSESGLKVAERRGRALTFREQEGSGFLKCVGHVGSSPISVARFVLWAAGRRKAAPNRSARLGPAETLPGLLWQ